MKAVVSSEETGEGNTAPLMIKPDPAPQMD